MLKKLTSVETYDHPLTFVPALLLVAIPLGFGFFWLAGKVGLNLPGLGQQN